MKTRQIIIIIVSFLLSGCLQSTLNLPPDEDKLKEIEAGTLEHSVRIIAGPPDRIEKSKSGYKIYYYREGLTADCQKDLQTCIPIVIENGKVTAVGRQWAKAWMQQRLRRDAYRSSRDTAAEEAANRKKIAELEKQVNAIPVSRTLDNLTIYRYLLKLDPDNARYKQKVAFYEERFENEKAKRVAAKKKLEAERKWQNKILRKFKGNPPVQLAAKILGNGKFYLWLKNTGQKPFRVDADQFFVSCRKGKRIRIYSSRDFGRDLKPGAVIEGRVTFNISCDPREIIYANPAVATVSRQIPTPE